MSAVKQKIEAVIDGDDSAANPLLRVVLWGASLLYGAAVRFRAASYRRGLLKTRRLPCKVVSVGNIVVGGTGKTPLTMHVTAMIRKMGFKVVVLSRGYKGKAETSGGIVSDGRKVLLDARMAGDEPCMMAKGFADLDVPVVVGRKRFKTGMAAIKRFQPEVIVLDDAFQHLGLARDLDLVLVNGNRSGSRQYLLPRGPLREPLSALGRCDALILVRSSDKEQEPRPAALSGLSAKRPIFQVRPHAYVARIIPPRTEDPQRFPPERDFGAAKPVFGFCGIAGNERFKRTLGQLSCDVRGFAGFADHHAYSDHDLKTILAAARQARAEYLITTEKDWVRIVDKLPLPMKLVVIGVKLDFGPDTGAFTDFLKEKLY